MANLPDAPMLTPTMCNDTDDGIICCGSDITDKSPVKKQTKVLQTPSQTASSIPTIDYCTHTD